jgi:predicted nuclease of predicted toxin-antitoxin system
MKILIDMNLSPRWVSVLSAAGISTVHWSSVGSANAPDAEIQIRSDDVSPEAAASVVTAAIRQMRSELEQGALVTVDPRRTRLRYLPLHPRTEG